VKRALALCVVAVALVATGCGSAKPGSSGSDPARLAPPSTLAYASFELVPQGPEKQDFDAAFGKLLGPDPEPALAKGLVDAIKEPGSPLDYEQDVKPWLGDTASVLVTAVGKDHCDFALLLASTDDGKARAAIDKDLTGKNAASRSYRGVDYRLLDGGIANAVVDHFLVAGTEPAVKAVIDADKDGKSLADSQQWKDSVGDRGNGKVGLAYLDVKAALQSLASQLPGAQRIAAPLLLGLVQLHPFVATLDANPDSLVVDVSSPGTPADKRGPAAASSPLIEQLPADAWFAAALPQVGQALTKLTDALKLNPLIAAAYAGVEARVKKGTGLDLERDVLAGIGDVAAFARGSTKATVGGALVVQADDAAALHRTVARLPGLVARSKDAKVRMSRAGFAVTSPEKPKPVLVRTTASKAVIAYGAPAMHSALASGGARLGDTDLFRKAAAAVGSRPTLFASFAPALELARSHHGDDPEFRKVAPRLAHLEYAAVGARREGDLDVVRAVLGLR
jgi:hypothetical protein